MDTEILILQPIQSVSQSTRSRVYAWSSVRGACMIQTTPQRRATTRTPIVKCVLHGLTAFAGGYILDAMAMMVVVAARDAQCRSF